MAYVSRTPYADVTYSEAMVTAEYPTLKTAWDALTDAVKTVYLNRASDKIDYFNYYGCKYVLSQVRQFPRDSYPPELDITGGDTPDDVLRACVIIALAVWSQEDSVSTVGGLIEIDGRTVSSESMGSASFSYESGTTKFIDLGIPDIAEELLRRYLINWRTVSVTRS